MDSGNNGKGHEKMFLAKVYILDHVDGCSYGEDLQTTQDKINFLRNTFKQEFGWRAEQVGNRKALREWLMGLPTALSLPYTHYDVLRFAESIGWLKPSASENQQDAVINVYWGFMANMITQLFDGYRVPE